MKRDKVPTWNKREKKGNQKDWTEKKMTRTTKINLKKSYKQWNINSKNIDRKRKLVWKQNSEL